MRKLSILFSFILILAASLAWAAPLAQVYSPNFTTFPKGGNILEIPGLSDEVSVFTDRDGVRHIVATNDNDLAIASGYVHCRDRLFQMDQTRRLVDGTEAELLGPVRLDSDIQARILGLHRAAERNLKESPLSLKDLLQVYADGVNHCIDTLPLPPEYELLELTQVRPWEAVDSIKIWKGITASFSLDIDTELTEDLLAFIAAGIKGGFDGRIFFFADVFRSAPMDPASTVPDATNGAPFIQAPNWKADSEKLARAREAARRVNEKFRDHPIFALALNRRESFAGSNEWGVRGSKTPGGRPIIANDPHLALNIPSTFYEWHLVVKDDPAQGSMNVSGVGFPGIPNVILGQNEYITWGATVNPMDVSDVFSDTLLVAQSECFSIGAPACIETPPGIFHPVKIESDVTYFFNVIGDNIKDNLVPAKGLPPEAETIFWVPFRSFGPILDIEDPSVLVSGGTTTALVLQYTGFHATRELQTIAIWNRAKNLSEFIDGLETFDVGSQNWVYADVDGNLAYFTSAEMPLRADLEAGTVVGLRPYFVRDGKSGLNNWIPDPAPAPDQAIPFEILPFDEMPQMVNPENDFFVNANNDPAGTTLDNDPLNQFRTSNPNAIYYLNPGYADGLRAGRITRLIEARLGKISFNDMKRFQSNTQQLDAELMTPFLIEAFTKASSPAAPIEMADLASDPDIIEAVGRLATWDFSTPTGIPEGYDAKDPNGFRRLGVPIPETKASIAATIYNMWRGQAIRNIIDDRLTSLGIPGDAFPGSREALKALHNLLSQDPYTGIAAAGIDWIPEPASLSAEKRRDLALLQALRDALDRLASPEFASAFGESTDQDDYRWGKLHRIVFEHPFMDAFNIPPQAGFEDLSPELLGLARDGGYEVVNRSGFSARAQNLNSFMFDAGSVRRYVGEAPTGPRNIAGVNVVPGGLSGIPGDQNYATQLDTWLTADYHTVEMRGSIPHGHIVERETFVPAP